VRRMNIGTHRRIDRLSLLSKPYLNARPDHHAILVEQRMILRTRSEMGRWRFRWMLPYTCAKCREYTHPCCLKGNPRCFGASRGSQSRFTPIFTDPTYLMAGQVLVGHARDAAWSAAKHCPFIIGGAWLPALRWYLISFEFAGSSGCHA